jgi:hypothetical protein
MELELFVIKNFNGEFMQKDFSFSKDKTNIKVFDLGEAVDVYNQLPNNIDCYLDETTVIRDTKSIVFVKLCIKTNDLMVSPNLDIDEFWNYFIKFSKKSSQNSKKLSKGVK